MAMKTILIEWVSVGPGQWLLRASNTSSGWTVIKRGIRVGKAIEAGNYSQAAEEAGQLIVIGGVIYFTSRLGGSTVLKAGVGYGGSELADRVIEAIERNVGRRLGDYLYDNWRDLWMGKHNSKNAWANEYYNRGKNPPPTDPVAIDLNGDGVISTIGLNGSNSVYFGGDGKKIASGWLGKEDGWLALYENGKIQLFGLQTGNGFIELRAN